MTQTTLFPGDLEITSPSLGLYSSLLDEHFI